MLRSIILTVLVLVGLAAPRRPAVAAGLTLAGTLETGIEAGLEPAAGFEAAGATLELSLRQAFSEAGAFSAEILVGEAGATLNEGFLDLYFDRTDLHLGKQRIAWGAADAVNPTDNLNPLDYNRPFEEDNRLAAAAVRVDHYLPDWTLEAVWLPVFVPAPLATQGSGWAVPITPPAGLPVNSLTVEDPVLPASGLAGSEWALRIGRATDRIVFSFSYFQGWDDLPAVHAAITPAVDPPGTFDMTLTPAYHRLRVLGADFTAAIGKCGIRGEAACFLTEDGERTDPEIKNPYLQAVVGVDRRYGEDFYWNIQYIYEYVTASAGTPGPDEGPASALMLILRGKPRAEWELSFCGVYNLTDGDYLARPGCSYSLADGITLRAGLVLLGGPPETRFGRFTGNDYLFVRLEAAF